jgi:hypothetical protein
METDVRIEQFEARLARVEAEVGIGKRPADSDSSDPHTELTSGQRIIAKLDVITGQACNLTAFMDAHGGSISRVRAAVDGACFRLGSLEMGQGHLLELLHQHSYALAEIKDHLSEPRDVA